MTALHYLRPRAQKISVYFKAIHAISKPKVAMNPLSSARTVLTAMITPAVLISACGSMILSTSSRLGRVVDRVRALSEKLKEISRSDQQTELTRERQSAIFQQLDKLTSRARLLQRCMVTFYLSLGDSVATSVAIGIVAAAGSPGYTLAPQRPFTHSLKPPHLRSQIWRMREGLSWTSSLVLQKKSDLVA